MIQDDGFWSTERLLPPKKRGAAPSGGVSLASLQSNGEEVSRWRERSFPELRSLYSVAVGSASALTSDSAGFSAWSKKLQGRQGDPRRPYSSYFSYAPCFGELNEKQQNTYLCIRSELLQGRRTRLDYSYLALYLYERLNALNGENAEETLENLLQIWRLYRGDFAVLDKLLSEWVADLCVEWELSFPLARLDGILSSVLHPSAPVLHTVYLFDYLLSGNLRPQGAQVEYVMNVLCDYHYRSVALYRDNALYAASMDGFLAHLFREGFLTEELQRDEFLSLKIPTRVTHKRSGYPGARLDAHRRRMLSYEYCPLLGDRNVKHRFTSLVKYVDNRVRRRMGMKIKFSSVSIALVHQRFIDLHFEAYFAARLPEDLPAVAGKAPVPKAEKRSLQVDLQRAAAIESDSWKTTDALVEALDVQGEEMVVLGEAPKTQETTAVDYCFQEGTQEDVTEFCASLDPLETEFVACLLYASTEEAKSFSRAKGQFFDTLVRRINQKALEFLADVVVDPSGRVIEDYREQMEFLLPKDQYLPFMA